MLSGEWCHTASKCCNQTSPIVFVLEVGPTTQRQCDIILCSGHHYFTKSLHCKLLFAAIYVQCHHKFKIFVRQVTLYKKHLVANTTYVKEGYLVYTWWLQWLCLVSYQGIQQAPHLWRAQFVMCHLNAITQEKQLHSSSLIRVEVICHNTSTGNNDVGEIYSNPVGIFISLLWTYVSWRLSMWFST